MADILKGYETGKKIHGLDDNGQMDDAIIYHAGTKFESDSFLTSGGRVLGVTTKGKDLNDALNKVYKAVDLISFEGMHYRKDIGKRALLALSE